MNKIKLVTLCLFGSLLIGLTKAPAPPKDVTMHGRYVWVSNKNEPGDLRAVFTPVEKGRWKVAFHFRFSGRKHVYRGTADGDLKNGGLKGTVKNERGNRTFLFEGVSKNGNFSGTHAERDSETEVEHTGTLTLSHRGG